jgi:hypothetical protein
VSEQIERDIEAVLEARTGRECVFMPSGRFAIHLAFQTETNPTLMNPKRQSRPLVLNRNRSQGGHLVRYLPGRGSRRYGRVASLRCAT